MSQRVLLASSTFALLVTLGLLLPATTLGQQTDTKVTTTFQTPWGDPDLQGIWDTDAMRSVPLERPTEFGERAMLTKEELAERATTEVAQRGAPDRPKTEPVRWDEWSERPSARTSIIVAPPNGQLPPLTLGAQQRPDDPTTTLGFSGGSHGKGPFNGPEDYNPIDRCITRGLPNTWFPSLYNNGFQIVQSPHYVALLYERLHEHRIIPIDGPDPLDPNIRTWFGDSRGHWEGDTLVVDTTHFNGQTWLDAAGNFHSESLHVVERYTPTTPYHIDYEVTIEDPNVFTRAWTMRMPLYRRVEPNVQLMEFRCVEFVEDLIYGHLRKQPQR